MARSRAKHSAAWTKFVGAKRSQGVKEMQRLLKSNGLIEIVVDRDGNCQFRAVGKGIGHEHEVVRNMAVQELREHRQRYQDHVTKDYDAYVQEVEQGEWGDNVTLQALANVFERLIWVINDNEANPLLCVEPDYLNVTNAPVFITFYAEIHYNATAGKKREMVNVKETEFKISSPKKQCKKAPSGKMWEKCVRNAKDQSTQHAKTFNRLDAAKEDVYGVETDEKTKAQQNVTY